MLAVLAGMHGTTLAEEVDKYNAASSSALAAAPCVLSCLRKSALARNKAVKCRALDKVKAKRAALKALKPKPSAEELAAKALARAERKKASRRKHSVKAHDALRYAKESACANEEQREARRKAARKRGR